MIKDNAYPKGPTKPITDMDGAIRFLRRLAKASERHFPTTSSLLWDCIKIIREANQERRKERREPK